MSLSNNSTPSQSIEIVDPEGSLKKGNLEPVNSKSGFYFYLIKQNLHNLEINDLFLIMDEVRNHIEEFLNSEVSQ
jgi:hypothetical protein